jgi:hypothetical protein
MTGSARIDDAHASSKEGGGAAETALLGAGRLRHEEADGVHSSADGCRSLSAEKSLKSSRSTADGLISNSCSAASGSFSCSIGSELTERVGPQPFV